MICTTCGEHAARLRIIKGKEYCAHCGGFSEANGTRIDGILSRQRVRGEAVKFEGHTLNPWKYEPSSKKFAPNEEFIKLHSTNAMNFYTPKDLKDYPKLTKQMYRKVNDVPEASHVGEYEPAIKEAITNAS